MKDYLIELTLVGFVTGVMGHLAPKLSPGINRVLEALTGIVLTLCLAAPLLAFLGNDGPTLDQLLPPVNTRLPEGSEEYYDRLVSLTVENLQKQEASELEKRFGYTRDQVSVELEAGVDSNGAFVLYGIRLIISDLSALSDRDKLIEALWEKYGCEITVSENIIKP